ncbi:Aerotaxis receptor [compost metagenome]
MKRPQPLLTESPFDFSELFFSTTNERGVIQFGNDVFVRVSEYPKETLKGAPHSIIRHPDMPKAVFKLLWNTIQAGEPIAAYVKNLAANGTYYWVLAFVFPIEGGYLSIRVKPSSALWEAAKNLYALTLEVEAKDGLEVSVPFLLEQIQKAGFKNYTDFMIKAAFAEVNNLEAKAVSAEPRKMTGVVGDISHISSETALDLKDCFKKIQGFQVSNQSFVSTMQTLSEGFQNLKYIALNMTVSAAKFGEGVASLGVVAKEFSNLSLQIQGHLSGLLEFVKILTDVIEKCALKIVALDVQMLMVDFFIRESIQKMKESENAFSDMIENRQNFSRLFQDYSKGLSDEVTSLNKHLDSISSQMMDIRKFTTGLEVIRQIGAVESSRENEIKQTFIHYLEEMRKFILLLQNSTGGIHKEISQMKKSGEQIEKSAAKLAGQVDTIFDMASTVAQTEGTSSNLSVGNEV